MTTDIMTTDIMTTDINLTLNSSLELSKLPDNILNNIDFDKMFEEHPIERCKVLTNLHQIDKKRWMKSYMNVPKWNPREHLTFMFSNLHDAISNKKNELPDIFKVFLDYVNENEDCLYNQVTINWYENGDDDISMHSDCTIDMLPKSDIVIISLGSDRTMIFKSKKSHEKRKITLENGYILKMKGNVQNEFTHGIKKEINKGKRISMSFRKYIENK
jgi:alkylated DNA repair dioxygenase AlkB